MITYLDHTVLGMRYPSESLRLMHICPSIEPLAWNDVGLLDFIKFPYSYMRMLHLSARQ